MTTTSIPALLEPIQARLNDALTHQTLEPSDYADMAWKTMPDTARLLAAVKAVTEVHKPVTLWMAHEDADVSYQSKEDLLAERADLTEADLVPFELCSHCRMIEDSPCEGECTMSAGYRESLWPCETVSAVESALRDEA